MCVGQRKVEKEFTAAEAAFSQAFCDAPPVQEFTHEKLMHTITYDKHMRNKFTLPLLDFAQLAQGEAAAAAAPVGSVRPGATVRDQNFITEQPS